MQSSRPIRILIVDDHEVVRMGLRLALAELNTVEIVAEAFDGVSAVAAAREFSPDVVLMDLRMPNMNGLEATRSIKADSPDIRILVLTSNDSQQHILSALSAGADGYCVKDAPINMLLNAIETIHGGGHWLDPQSARVVQRVINYTPRGLPAATHTSAGSVLSSGEYKAVRNKINELGIDPNDCC